MTTVEKQEIQESEMPGEPQTALPVHSRAKAAIFTLLVILAVFINIVCGVVCYAIYTGGEILEDLYSDLASRDLDFFVWVAAGVGLLGAIITLVAYALSFDFRRPARPIITLWILLTSFALFLIGLLLGILDISSDNVPVILGAGMLCFIFPLPVLYAERLVGRGALKTARKFLASKSPSSARASARTALTLLPGKFESRKTYGLSLAAAGRHLQALPYLVYTEEHEDPLEPATAAALADSWETAGDREKTIAYLDMLPPDRNTPELLERKVRLWLDAGKTDRACEALAAMTPETRRPWRDEYRALLLERRDQTALQNLCAEIHAEDESPFEKTVQCYKDLLSLFPSDTSALINLIDLQKSLKEHDTVAALQEELLTLDESRHDVRRELINYYWEHGNRLELLRHLNRLMMADQATTEEKLRLLEETYTEGDYLRIEQLIAQESDLATNPRALFILATALFQGGRNEEALERISQARRLGVDEQLGRNIDGLAAKIKKMVLNSELTTLEERAAVSPGDLDLKFDYLDHLVANRAADRVVVQLDDLLEAQPELIDRVEKEIRVMLSRHGKNRRLMDYLGDLYLRRRDYDKAFELYERRAQGEMDAAEILHDAAQRILEKKPDHAPSLLAEMKYYHGQGDPAATLEKFDRLQTIGAAAETDVLLMELEAAEKSGDMDRAIATGERLLAQEPENTELLSRVGGLSVAAGDFPRAIAHLQKATELDPDSFDYRRQLRSAVETMKKNRIAEIKEILARHPGNRDLLEELGDLYHDFDQLNEAIASYQRAGINDQERRAPKAKQGYVLARKGMFTDADEILKEADLRSDLPQDVQEILKNLFYITAQLMEEEDENDRALELYRRIFRVDAGYQDVVEHIERLQVSGKKKRQQY